MSATAALTPSDREAAGKAARKATRRSSHASWEPGSGRPDPIEILERQDSTRVPELVPIRHGRMLASAFAFYRGGAAIMAGDLARTPRSGLDVQLCGDAHLTNFGVFAAPDRSLIFDINDFDETHPGPFEWDLKRLAASFEIAGRQLGFKARDRRSAVAAATREYREEMRRLASQRSIDVWYARMDVAAIEKYRSQVSKSAVKRFDKNIAKAQRKDSLRAFAKLTRTDGDTVRIVSDPPLLVPIEELAEAGEVVSRGQLEERLKELIEEYRGTLHPDIRHLSDAYRYVHSARKVVGVGSVGTRAWIVLLLGRDTDDPLFLQVKEAETSVLAPFAGDGSYRQQGQRVVQGQRLMQAASDIMLGWLTVEDVDGVARDYYVRQLWDGKGSAAIEEMDETTMPLYANLCGWTLARAHARSGDRIAIASYLGRGDSFDRAIREFADAYADQNESDFKAFEGAVESGRLAAAEQI